MNKEGNRFKKLISSIDQKKYANRDFVIISNNCWGAEIYKRLNKPYNTPFVGLFLFGPDYLKLLQNFDHYLDDELQFVEQSKWVTGILDYPVALLKDVEIHFMHYKDKEEAREKWSRRLNRMKKVADKNNYYFKICDRDFATSEVLLSFHQLPFKNKLSFGASNLNVKDHITIKEARNQDMVPDGVKLYKTSYKYIDVLKWLNSGKKHSNRYSKLKYLLKLV